VTYRAGVVYDAPGDLILIVTAEDVKGAIPKDCNECILSRAHRRIQDGLHVDTSVSRQLVEQPGGHYFRYLLPHDTKALLEGFDTTLKGPKDVAEFRLLAPKEGKGLAKERQRKRNISNARAQGKGPDPNRSAKAKRGVATRRARRREGVR
jgi:hypothetical protein